MVTISLWKPATKNSIGRWSVVLTVNDPLTFARIVGAPGMDGDAKADTMDRLCRAISKEFKRPAMLNRNGRETVIDEICRD